MKDILKMVNIGLKTCRICMVNDGLLSVHDSKICEKLQSLQITINEILPNKICLTCIKDLNFACDFIEKAKNTESILSQPLSSNPTDGDIKFAVSEINLLENNQNITGEISVFEHQFANSEQHAIKKTEQLLEDQNILKKEPSIFMKESNKRRSKRTVIVKQLKNEKTVLKYSCDLCGLNLKNKSILKKHMLSVHLKKEKIKCLDPKCTKVFFNENFMRSHAFQVHQMKSCPICNESRSSWSILKVHMETVHVDSKNFLCSDCGKRFKSKRALRNHTYTHEEDKTFCCNLCPKKYITQSGLSFHKTMTHKKKKPYACDFEGCQLKFSVPCHLKNHKRTHTGEKPYKCDLCEKSFRESKQRTNHRRTHTGEKPFKCDFDSCGRAFTQKFDMILHRRIHTGEKPYQCTICPDFKFRVNSALKTHMKAHHQTDTKF